MMPRDVPEEERVQHALERRVPYSDLRRATVRKYTLEEGKRILNDPRIQQAYAIRELLGSESIQLSRNDRMGHDKRLYKTRNLSTGHLGRIPLETGNVGATGFCFSRYPCIESLCPLLILDEMLNEGALSGVVIAYPSFIYGIRGYNATEHFREAVLVTAGIFGDRIGKTVSLMPDDKVFLPKSLITFYTSPKIGVRPSEAKYKKIHKEPTYYDYIRTVFSAADVILAGESYERNSTVVADTLDGEIIHSTYYGNAALGRQTNIVMTATFPRLDGQPAVNSYEVSSQEGVLSPLEPANVRRKVRHAKRIEGIPEIDPAFNNLFLLVDESLSTQAYANYSDAHANIMAEAAADRLADILREGERTIDLHGSMQGMIDNSLQLLNIPQATERLYEHIKKRFDTR